MGVFEMEPFSHAPSPCKAVRFNCLQYRGGATRRRREPAGVARRSAISHGRRPPSNSSKGETSGIEALKRHNAFSWKSNLPVIQVEEKQ